MNREKARSAALLALGLLAASCNDADRSAPRPSLPPREVSLDEAPSARCVIDRMSRFHVDSAPIVPPGSALGFIAQGDRVRAVIASAERARSLGPVDVELPQRASGDVSIKDLRSGMGVRFRDSAAGSSEIAIADGLAAYGAAEAKKSALYRVHAEGVEDYVLFEQPPSSPELRYELDVSAVAGLRLVSDELEFLGRDGAPRLRVGRPFLVDAQSQRHEARLKLEGCAYDEDPRMPWGRAVTPSLASHCVLRVVWDSSAVRYPAVLDPAWTSTCSMSDEYVGHEAVRLKDGRVLIVRPAAENSSPLGDIYDPKTGTWAVTQRPLLRNSLPAVVLQDGRVLTASLIYDPTSGKITPTSLTNLDLYSRYTLTALDNGKAVVLGGDALTKVSAPQCDRFVTTTPSNGEIFDPATNKWLPVPGFAAAGAAAVKLADGQVLVAGGEYHDPTPNSVDNCHYRPLDDCRFDGGYSVSRAGIFDPATNQVREIPPMTEPRLDAKGVLLGNGKVLIVGEWRCERRGCPVLGCVKKRNEYAGEIYDPVTNTWEPAAARELAPTSVASFVTLPDGNALMLGPQPNLLEAATGRWFAVQDYLDPPRQYASATLLQTGKVLVAGGTKYGTPPVYGEVNTSSAELYEGGRLGTSCVADGECVTGHCVDGVCCDGACTGFCQACSSAKKGPKTADGRCGPILKGNDPDSECHPIGSGACQTPGTCDGAGSCLTKAGEVLGPKTCADLMGTPGIRIYANIVYDSCNELGEPARAVVSCYPGSCSGGECWFFRCSEDWECQAGCDKYWGLCQGSETWGHPAAAPRGTKTNGSPCSSGNDCASSYCVEGVCCASDCGICNSCVAARKANGPDGTCGPVKAGTDPRGQCSISAGCSSGGLCGADGRCAPKPAGSSCGDTVCQDTTTITGFVCDQNAQCVQGTGSCGAYACGNNVCKICCASEADCAPGFECRECACVGSLPAGQPCTSANQCQSGFCADGRCCDTACSGQCEACDLAGREGTCSAVSGPPHGSRPACSGASGSSCAGSCNGVYRGACDYPRPSTSCGHKACADGSATTSNCDGIGTCVAATKSCDGYGCEGDQCRTTCQQESDCAPGYACKSGVCMPNSDAGDAGETSPPDGGDVDSSDAGGGGGSGPQEPARDGGEVDSSDAGGGDCSGPQEPARDGGEVDSSDAAPSAGSPPNEPPAHNDGCSVSPNHTRDGQWFGLVALAAALGVIGNRRARRRPQLTFARPTPADRAVTAGKGRTAALIALALLAMSCNDADRSPPRPSVPPREVSLDEAPSARRVIDQMSRFHVDSGPMVPRGSALGFIAQGDRVRAVIASAERARSFGPVDVELPRRASGDVSIRDLRSGLGVRFRDSAAGSSEIAIADGLAAYGAAEAKKSALYRVHAEGVEDYVLFEEAPSSPELRYEIDVSAVAGMRLMSNVLEFLDGGGAPRLRVASPFLVDSEGERHHARLKLEGCAYDDAARMPWGRSVTAPGASHCVLRVAWDSSAVRYPAVLDPAWTSTCSMSRTTGSLPAQAVRLKDGRVLIMESSRRESATPYSPVGDIYDPTTGTWATPPRPVSDNSLPAVVLADGRVLTSHLLYDPTSGQWTVQSGPGVFNVSELGAHSLTALDNGRAVAFGGYWRGGYEGVLPAAAGKSVFDPVTNTWRSQEINLRGTTPGVFQGGFSAAGHAAVKLADGRVLLAGGEFRSGWPASCSYPSAIDYRVDVHSISHAAIYDPATDSIAAIAPMTESRLEPQGVLLANGKVLIVGPWRCESRGCKIMGCDIKRNQSAAEIYDPATNTWTPVGGSDLTDDPYRLEISGPSSGSNINFWYYLRNLSVAPLVLLPDGNVLRTDEGPSLFETATGRWFAVPDYREPQRRSAAATLLETGKVLVAGGMVREKPPVHGWFDTTSAELYEGGRLGTACAANGECVSGHCVDGLCCDSACTGLCEGCSSAKKGPGTVEGQCGPIKKGNDPDSECEPIGTGACQTLGTCDGAGACLTRAGEAVGPKTCADPFFTDIYSRYANVVFDSCNERGEPAPGVTNCYPGACVGGGCQLGCQDHSHCQNSFCQTWWGLCGDNYYSPIPPDTKSNGVPCVAYNECASGYCVEGVCCERGSTCGVCQSCLAALKASGPDGVCGPVKEGTDPRGACAISADCSNSGVCGPNGGCAPKPAGSACGETVCQDATTIAGLVCDQNAQCVQGTGSCGAYACGNNVCKFCCASKADCAPGFVCRECACIPALTTGEPCTAADQCQSGFCADGRCCDGACSGQCEACDVAGSEGTCSAVTGAPRGSRPACSGASGSPCAGSCNGVDRGACSYPSSSTSCAPVSDAGDAGEIEPDGGAMEPSDASNDSTSDSSTDSSNDAGGGGSAGSTPPGTPEPPDDGCSVSPLHQHERPLFGLVALAVVLGIAGRRRGRRMRPIAAASVTLAILATCAQAFGAGGDFEREVEDDAPIAFYRLSEASGDNAAFDRSVNALHGVYSSTGLTLEQIATEGDHAALFSGGSVLVDESPVLNPSQISVEAVVVWQGSTGVQQRVCEKSTAPAGHDAVYGLSIDSDGTPHFEIQLASGEQASLPGCLKVTENQPVHVAATYDGLELALWVDGAFAGSFDQPGTLDQSTARPFEIGNQAARDRAFNGLIDEVALYDRALSAERLLMHAQAIPELGATGAAMCGDGNPGTTVEIDGGCACELPRRAGTSVSLSWFVGLVLLVASMIRERRREPFPYRTRRNNPG